MNRIANAKRLQATVACVDKFISRKRHGRQVITKVIRSGTVTMSPPQAQEPTKHYVTEVSS